MSLLISKLKKAIQDPAKIILYCTKYRIFRLIPDCTYLKMVYRLSMKKKLNLKNPTTFNEKMQWLKLYDRKPIYTTMVDKAAVKKYVADRVGDEYIIPTLGIWDSFDEIDFDSLPDQFVLKCTHDSGGVVIVRDKSKLDFKKARKKLSKYLKRDYFYQWREWPYKNVPKKILAEAYMEDEKTSELRDYKFMCFHGEVKCTLVCTDRFSEDGLHMTFFDRDWNVLPFERSTPVSKESLPAPLNYERMLELSEKLSYGLSFVRVDFYEVSGKVYFGELTFFPGTGLKAFQPEKWDEIIGSWLDLSHIEGSYRKSIDYFKDTEKR